MFNLEINTSKFKTGADLSIELPFILRGLADTMERGEMPECVLPDTYAVPLFDSDGNEVGGASFEEDFGDDESEGGAA